MQAQTLATSVTQPWAKNNLFKAHVTRIKSKSMEAAGILRHVANLISSDPQATLKQGTSVGYLCVCSSGSNNVTSGLQLTRSKFILLVTSGFYPFGLDRKYFSDLSAIYSGYQLEERLLAVRTETLADEPLPAEASLGLTSQFEATLLNLFYVLDLTFKLLSAVAEEL